MRLCIHGSASSSRSIHASCNTHLLCNCTLEYCRRHIAILFHWLPCIIHDPFIHPFISSHSFLYFIFACCIYNPFQCRRRVVIVCVCVSCVCASTHHCIDCHFQTTHSFVTFDTFQSTIKTNWSVSSFVWIFYARVRVYLCVSKR